MAGQSVGIMSREQGSFVACRNAREQDGSGNARLVQLVDFVSRALDDIPTIRGSAGSEITTSDAADKASFPTELTDNLIAVGDQSVLVVAPFHTATDGEVTITPLIFNQAGDTLLSILPSKVSGMGSVSFSDGSSYVSPLLQWDLMGAPKIGIHISSVDGTSNGVIIKGAVL